MSSLGRRDLMLAGLALGLAGCSASTAAPLVSPPASPAPPEPSDPPASTPTASATPRPGWTARVMTYNMLTPNLGGAHFRAAVKDSDVRLSNRVPVMARWIRGANPDIVGLQENEANPPRRLPVGVLAPLLPAYEVIHPRLNVPLLVRKKAFDVLADGSLDITQGHLPRHVGWCRVRHLRSGHVVLVANTHLDPFQKAYKASQRAAEAREIVALLEKLNPGGTLPTILRRGRPEGLRDARSRGHQQGAGGRVAEQLRCRGRGALDVSGDPYRRVPLRLHLRLARHRRADLAGGHRARRPDDRRAPLLRRRAGAVRPLPGAGGTPVPGRVSHGASEETCRHFGLGSRP
jgi:hypothetical protein